MSCEIKHPGLAPLWIEEAVKEGEGERNVVIAKDESNPVKESKRVGHQLVERDPEIGRDLLKKGGIEKRKPPTI